jgi:hypothetical protein
MLNGYDSPAADVSVIWNKAHSWTLFVSHRVTEELATCVDYSHHMKNRYYYYRRMETVYEHRND